MFLERNVPRPIYAFLTSNTYTHTHTNTYTHTHTHKHTFLRDIFKLIFRQIIGREAKQTNKKILLICHFYEVIGDLC